MSRRPADLSRYQSLFDRGRCSACSQNFSRASSTARPPAAETAARRPRQPALWLRMKVARNEGLEPAFTHVYRSRLQWCALFAWRQTDPKWNTYPSIGMSEANNQDAQ